MNLKIQSIHIYADIAGMYMYGQKFEEGLNYLYRSINQLAMFPNRYWNSDYGLAGAANTFRLLLLMCPKNHMELCGGWQINKS